MFKKIISSTLAFLLFSASAFAAPDYSASRGYFRNATVTDIGTSGAYVDVSSSYSLDGERATVLILVRNTGTTSSAGNIVVKRQGGDNLTYVSGTLEKRCPPTDSAYVGIDASWATFNGAGYDLGTMASGRTCAIRYNVDLGATGNDFSTVSQDIATVYDNGSLVQTLTVNLYAPFYQAYQARDKGPTGDEVVVRFAETPFIDATNPTTHVNSAANPNNYEMSVNSGAYTAFSGTVTYTPTNKEVTLFPSSNLIAAGDTVAVKLKNLKTDYGRFLNFSNYTTASVAGLTTTTITALDKKAPSITNALYSASSNKIDIVFSESMLTGFTNAVISVDNGNFDSPTLSWPTISGYSAGQILRLTLGSGKTVTPATTQFYFNPASSVTDLAGNAVTNDSSSKVDIAAGSLESPEVSVFTIADASTTSISAYTNAQTVSVTSFTGTSSGGALSYALSESNTQPLAAAFGVLPATYTLSGFVHGTTYTVYPWVKDSNDMSSIVNANAFKKTITVDTLAPSFTVTDDANTSANNSDTISVSIADAHSGVNASTREYALSADAVCNSSDSYSSSTGTVIINSNNTGYVCFRVQDNLGNQSYSSAIGPLHVDSTAPTITVNSTSTNDTTPALSGTVNDASATIQVTVNGLTYSATNNGDGTWTLANNTITPALTNGTYSVTATATDGAGNVGTEATTNELEIDTTLISATVTYSSDPVKAGNLTITVVFGKSVVGTPTISIDQQGTTDVTNQNLTHVSGNTWNYVYAVNTANGGTYVDGVATVSFLAVDHVGNGVATPSDPNFVIDTTSPVLTEVTAIGTTTSTTPSYIFSSTDSGTLSLSGSCSTGTTNVTAGNNTITFNTLALGTYSNCSLTVTDTAGNVPTSLNISSFTITSSGGGGGGGGSSGPDTKTVYKMPASESEKLVELIRPVQAPTGLFTRPVQVKEYSLGSLFTVEKDTIVTDAQGQAYTGIIYPIVRVKSTEFNQVALPKGKSLVYGSVFTVAGDNLFYSKPIDIKLILPAALKSYVEQNTGFKIIYWVPFQNSAKKGEWKVLGEQEKIKDGVISLTLPHSTYVVFIADSSGTTEEETSSETDGNMGGGTETPVSDTQKAEVLQNLTDIQGHWAEDFIVNLYTKGVVKGQGDTKKFFPNDSINRAAFLKIVLELFNYQISSSGENPFVDVSSSDWFTPYVFTAYKKGIVKGYELPAGKTIEPITFVSYQEFSPAVENLQNALIKLNFLHVDATGYFGAKTTEAIMFYQKSKSMLSTGYLDEATLAALNAENIFSPAKTIMEFRAGKNINRAEALIIMFKAAGITVPKATSTDFTDVPLDSWFADYVSYAKANGIVKGKSETRFAPADNITRAEAVKIAINMFEFKSKQ